jgi:hypothetical protein
VAESLEVGSWKLEVESSAAAHFLVGRDGLLEHIHHAADQRSHIQDSRVPER